MGNQPIFVHKDSTIYGILDRVTPTLNLTLTYSCKIALQAILKASGPLKPLLDIIRPVPIQYGSHRNS